MMCAQRYQLSRHVSGGVSRWRDAIDDPNTCGGFMRWRVVPAMLATMTVWACAPEIPERDAPVERVEAIFNPATSTIPLPNDAALSEGRLPALEGAGEATASGQFAEFLTQLSGWLPSQSIEI